MVLELHGEKITLVERKCKKCPNLFRVMKGSEQKYCSRLCKARSDPSYRHAWLEDSAFYVRPGKGDLDDY